MHQEIIGDAGQPLAGFLIADALRLVAAVARGEHNRAAKVFHQQMMERRVGQHEAQRRLAGRDAGGHGAKSELRPLTLSLSPWERDAEFPLRIVRVPSPRGRGTG